jgi:hypothetical protein
MSLLKLSRFPSPCQNSHFPSIAHSTSATSDTDSPAQLSCRNFSYLATVPLIFPPWTWPHNTSSCMTRDSCCTCRAHSAKCAGDLGGILSRQGDRTEGILGWTSCKFGGDALDGRVNIWCNSIVDPDQTRRDLNRLKLQSRPREEIVPADALRNLLPEKRPKEGEEERLNAQFYCRAVKFYLTGPNDGSWTTIPQCHGVLTFTPSREP